jgi:four helix bundle protein
MSQNVLKDKSYEFAIMIVKTSEQLVAQRKEFILSKQLLRSGTSIGALIREAEFAQRKADFINKMSVALKEANENFILVVSLKDTNYISAETFMDLSKVCKELISILVVSIKTSKLNQ